MMAPAARLLAGAPLHPVLTHVLSTSGQGAGPSTYPAVPSVDDLLACSSSLLAAKAAAETRAAACREAARIQRGAMDRVARRADEDRRGQDRERERDRDRERADRERRKREESIRRDAELRAARDEVARGKEREAAAATATSANGGTASPAFRVKRELSGGFPLIVQWGRGTG